MPPGSPQRIIVMFLLKFELCEIFFIIPSLVDFDLHNTAAFFLMRDTSLLTLKRNGWTFVSVICFSSKVCPSVVQIRAETGPYRFGKDHLISTCQRATTERDHARRFCFLRRMYGRDVTCLVSVDLLRIDPYDALLRPVPPR